MVWREGTTTWHDSTGEPPVVMTISRTRRIQAGASPSSSDPRLLPAQVYENPPLIVAGKLNEMKLNGASPGGTDQIWIPQRDLVRPRPDWPQSARKGQSSRGRRAEGGRCDMIETQTRIQTGAALIELGSDVSCAHWRRKADVRHAHRRSRKQVGAPRRVRCSSRPSMSQQMSRTT